MKKIKIHRFNNEQWGRAHLPFFKRFDEYLKNFFYVEVINYNTDGNTFTGKINTLRNVATFGQNPPLSDVDCVIENQETGDIKVLSFGEYFNNFVIHYAKSNVCSKVLLVHFNWHNLYYWMKRENAISEISKVRPWIFLPFSEFDYLKYRKKRDNCVDLNKKMYWQGSGVDDYRKCVRFLEQDDFLQKIEPMNHDLYLEKMSQSKIGMSYYQTLDRYRTPFDYPGEFCYRDIEYMSIGLPFIRIEYKDSVHDPLLPNVHYISIPRDVAHIEFEKNGERGIANLYIQRYKEVIEDETFLSYVSKNQKEWFDRNILSPNSEKLTFDLLNLIEWVNLSDSETVVKKTIVEEDLKIKETNEVIVEHFDRNIYNGYTLQQNKNVFNIFKTFIKEIKPKRVLEIGTAGGGFTAFLRDCLNEVGLTDSVIKSYEVLDAGFYDELRNKNIEIIIDNIFDKSYTILEKYEEIDNFIKSEGTTLVLCDGGNKVSEFNILSKLLKPGDFILAHDYAKNLEVFKEKIYNKFWLWCEITEEDIKKVSEEENLVFYNQDEFDKIVWVCKIKEKSNEKNSKILSEKDFQEICNKISECYFIQIGANNGKSTDPINGLIIKNNWSGVLIEPGFEAFNELKETYAGRNNLIFEMCAISDVDGKVNLYCGTTTPHFTLDFEKAKWMFCIEPIAREVDSLTISSLINKHNIKNVDVLQIDTEGYDFIILKTFPFDLMKPKVVRYEHVCLKESVKESIDFIESFGYKTYFSEDGADVIAIL